MNDSKQILTAELISMTGGVLSGGLLAYFNGTLSLIPGILIFLPGFLELSGNLNGSLAARLGSKLHLGSIKPSFKNKVVGDNIIALIALTILASFTLGLFAYLISLLLGFNNPKIILIALLSGILSEAFLMPLTIISTFYLFKHELDPDNIMGPYVTTIGDIISTISLVIVMVII